MRRLRFIALLPLVLGLFVTASADFDGPAPLSWRWAQASRIPPAGTPLVVGDIIYVADGTRVFALDKDTGNEKWKFPTIQDIQGDFRKTPVMAGGMLVVTTDNYVYGLDPDTGAQKWYYKLLDPTQMISGQPVSTGKFVVCALNAEYLVALNAEDGKEVWPAQAHIFDHIRGDMSTYGDTLFFFTQNNALCSLRVTDPGKVKTLGQFSTLSEDAVPILRGETLYVNTGTYLAAFSAASGFLRWQVDTREDLVFGPAASSEGEAVISRDGILTIVDTRGNIKSMKASTGKGMVDMKIDLQSGAAARPSAAGKLFVVPTLNGAINLVDPKDGSILWRYMVHPMSEEEAAKRKTQRGAAPGQSGFGQTAGQTTTPGQSNDTMGSSGIDRPDPANYSVQAAGPATVVGDTLLMLADDGSLLSFDKNTGVDVTGPDIRMVYPNPGSEVNSDDLGVAFRISDDASGVKDDTITVTANGKAVDNEFTADGLDIVRFNLHGKNDLLPDGRVEFVITAFDWMGNSTTEKYSLTIDNTLPKLYQPKLAPGQGGGGAGGGGGRGGGGGGGGGGRGGGK